MKEKLHRSRSSHSDKKKAIIFKQTEYKCWYCGYELNFNKFPNPYYGVIDHIEPFIYGGSNKIDNLRASCFKCNQEKRSLNVSEYRMYLAKKTSQCKAYIHLIQAVKHFKFSNHEEIEKAIEEAKHSVPFTIFYGESIGK